MTDPSALRPTIRTDSSISPSSMMNGFP
jgi:hypothetical protein